MREAMFFKELIAAEYLEALEESKVLPLNVIDCYNNIFVSFSKWFVIPFSIFARRNTGPFS